MRDRQSIHRPAELESIERRARRGLGWVRVALVFGCLCSGCRSDTQVLSKPKRGPGIGPPSTATPTYTLPSSAEVNTELAANAAAANLPGTQTPLTMQANTAAPSGEAAQDPQTEPRDFSAELVRMFGDPASCVVPRANDSAPSQLPIALLTRVMPSGAVANSVVSAPGLDPSEIQCLRRRLEALHFAGPIENAPFPVSGDVTLTRTPPPTTPKAPAAAAAVDPSAPTEVDSWKEPEAPPPVVQNTEDQQP